MSLMTPTDELPSLLYTDASGEHLIPLERPSTSIGRSLDQDLVLTDSYVSRRHASIHRVNSHYEIVDQKSSHGTYLNGNRVESARLNAGDILQFGSLSAPVYRFQNQVTRKPGPTEPFTASLLRAFSSLAPGLQEPQPGAHQMEQLSFLINSARRLNAMGAIDDILRVLLESSIKLTGVERGFVFLCENGEMRLALGLRGDGKSVEDDPTISRRAMQKAIESESKFSVSDTLADHSTSEWASIVANSIRAIYCIPLRKHSPSTQPNRLLGLLYLDSQIRPGHLSAIDHEVLEMVAVEAATLLENALLAQAELKHTLAREELAVAARIHAGLMSFKLPTVSFASFEARTVPCRAIGGDFFDATTVDNCICTVVADVSGKGVAASIVAATLQGIIHAQLLTRQELPELAAVVNQFLIDRGVGKYATMVLLKIWPNGKVEYLNCGHVPPVVVTASGTRQLQESNLVVGLVPGAQYKPGFTSLTPGDRILLFTDGITEAENGRGEQFGEMELEAILHRAGLDQILHRLARFQGQQESQDDCTLCELVYRGR
ncbi:FHA domain-containing protein [Acidobacteria bacterium AB60]|nr:FHA domain-containing protein [Acidobacteria bacterium AB60]